MEGMVSPYLRGRLQAHTPVTEASGLPQKPRERLEWYRGRRDAQKAAQAILVSLSGCWSGLEVMHRELTPA